MTDTILELSQNPFARNLVAKVKLPIPLPERLERPTGPIEERLLEGTRAVVGGQSALSPVLARVLTRSGATPLLADAALESDFQGPGEAYGRHAQLAPPAEADRQAPIDSLVLDASAVADAAGLKLLHELGRAFVPALAHHGRVLVLGRPPAQAQETARAAAQAALSGFTRSVAKEIGGKAATANLLYVADGAEDRIAAPVRFLLSRASAFVTAQPLTVDARVRWDGDAPWSATLEGKVALVTGAARGIGEATARALAEEGAHVVCLDRPEDDAALSAVARETGGSTLPCDVLDAEAPEQIRRHLREQHGGVDIVVHNAGVTRDRTLARMDDARWDQCLGINLEAVLKITDALLAGGKSSTLRSDGRIVSLSSIAGIAGNNGQTNYGASKAGIIGFTQHLAGQLAPRGISVNAVAPGFIETRMTAAVPVVVREAGRRLAALGQGGLPEDVARAITFLSTPGAAGVTGNVLRICGGALIGA